MLLLLLLLLHISAPLVQSLSRIANAFVILGFRRDSKSLRMLSAGNVQLRQLAFAGWAGVDILFVISALLATRSLLPKLEAAGESVYRQLRVVAGYMISRAWRLLPTYWMFIGVSALCMHSYIGCSTWVDLRELRGSRGEALLKSSCPAEFADVAPVESELWAAVTGFWFGNFRSVRSLVPNILCYSNNLDLSEAFALMTWSQSLQLQFFAALPAALVALAPGVPGFRARVAAAAAVCFLGCMAYRASLVEQGVSFPFSLLGASGEAEAPQSHLDRLFHMYFRSAPRFGQFAAGVLLAIVHDALKSIRLDKPLLGTPSTRRLVSNLLGITSVLMVSLIMAVKPISETPATDMYSKAFQHVYFNAIAWGPVTSLAWGVLMLLAVERAGLVGQGLAALARFAAPVSRHIARISYSLYFVHFWAILLVWRYAMPAMGVSQQDVIVGSGTGWVLHVATVLGVSYVMAVAMHYAVESALCPTPAAHISTAAPASGHAESSKKVKGT